MIDFFYKNQNIYKYMKCVIYLDYLKKFKYDFSL